MEGWVGWKGVDICRKYGGVPNPTLFHCHGGPQRGVLTPILPPPLTLPPHHLCTLHPSSPSLHPVTRPCDSTNPTYSPTSCPALQHTRNKQTNMKLVKEIGGG